jgi:hypothetical protein
MHLPKIRRPRYAEVVATLALFLAFGGVAYAATIAPDNSVRTQSIQNQAVTAPKLADEAVNHAKLAPDSVFGGDVSPNSLTLSDLRGIDESGPISFTINAHSCARITFGVTGASAGQAAVLTWIGAVPTHIMFGPLKVIDAQHIISYACNVGGVRVVATGIRVRIITFG